MEVTFSLSKAGPSTILPLKGAVKAPFSPLNMLLIFLKPAPKLEGLAALPKLCIPPAKPLVCPLSAPPANEPIPPIAPAVTPALSASPISPPLIKVAMPVPNAAPQTGPKTIVPTAGRTKPATFFNVFLTPLKTLLKKPNSIKPVSGLIELSEEPTTYLSGSVTP